MDQLKDKKLAKPWLFQILRREALRNWVPATEAHDEDRDQRTGAHNVGLIEQRLDVLGAMQALAPIQREVLTLFYFEDMPVSDMAIALEIAPGTVLSRLNRAREAMRAVMIPAPASAAAPAIFTRGGEVVAFPAMLPTNHKSHKAKSCSLRSRQLAPSATRWPMRARKAK